MKNYLKFLIFTLCLSGGFFGAGLLNKAQAACDYKIEFYERDGKTSVTPSDYLSFSIQVVRSGSDQECGSSIGATLLLKGKVNDSQIGYSIANFASVQGYGSLARVNLGVDIKTIDRSVLPVSNMLEFYIFITSNKTAGNNNLAESVSHIKIPVTGAVGGSGSLTANIYFKDGQTGAQKATFKANDQIQILIQANSNQVNNLSSSIGNIYAAVYVNDFAKEVLNLNADRSAWASQTQYKTLTVSKENGFIDGTNTVRVKFFQANTSVSLGFSDSTVQAQGLGTASSGATCSGTGKSTCADGQTCVNNKCQTSGTTPPAGGQTPPAGGMQGQGAQTLYNPIKDASNLTELLLKIMRGFIYITGIWAVAFIIIGGFKMVISQGNEEAVTAAKKSIMWSVLGLIVVLLAFSIIAIIQNLIGIDVQDVKTSQNSSYNITQKI